MMFWHSKDTEPCKKKLQTHLEVHIQESSPIMYLSYKFVCMGHRIKKTVFEQWEKMFRQKGDKKRWENKSGRDCAATQWII